MKKKGIAVLLVFLMACVFSIPAFAVEPTSNYTITTKYSDGSYLLTKVVSGEASRVTSTKETITSNITYQKTGTKTISYYAANNTLEWNFSVTGTFQYNGSSATAISSYPSYTIYDTAWSCANKDSYVSGSTATADGTFKNVTLLTRNVSTSLTCSSNGALS